MDPPPGPSLASDIEGDQRTKADAAITAAAPRFQPRVSWESQDLHWPLTGSLLHFIDMYQVDGHDDRDTPEITDIVVL